MIVLAAVQMNLSKPWQDHGIKLDVLKKSAAFVASVYSKCDGDDG